MSNKKVFIVDSLNEEGLQKALELESNCIISNEVKLSSSIPEGIEIINAEIYRVDGTWEIYNYIQNIVNRLCLRTPKQFISSGINLQPAMCKLIYWTNYRLGALKVAFNKIEDTKSNVNNFQFINANKSKEVLKYFKNYLSNNWQWLKSKHKSLKVLESNAKIGVLINNEFELKLYQDTIKLIGNCIVFYNGNIDLKEYDFKSEKIQFVNLSNLKRVVYQPFSNPFNKNSEELFVTNIILKDWIEIANELEHYKYISKTGIKKLLINVGENLALRNLMPQVFESNIMVYNSMNGLKSAEGHDADVNFDKWFVWDQDMFNLLNKQCHIPAEKLIISGHLSEDQIADHKFQNSIQIDLESIENKKVISIFSVRGHRKEKVDAFKVLYDFLESHKDFFLIVKPHPLEKMSDYIFPNSSLKNVYFIPEELKNSKSALFDQLTLSDLTIVFGSTVALESNWMGVPCITYEYKEKSFIYNLESADTQHINDENQLLLRLVNTEKKITKSNPLKPKVCEVISSHLLTI